MKMGNVPDALHHYAKQTLIGKTHDHHKQQTVDSYYMSEDEQLKAEEEAEEDRRLQAAYGIGTVQTSLQSVFWRVGCFVSSI